MNIPIRDHSNLRNLSRDLDELAVYAVALRDVLTNASCPDETETAAILVGLLVHRIEAVRDRYEIPRPIVL